MPQHPKPLDDRRAATTRAAGSVAAAFVVASIVFGAFYLGSRMSGPANLGATSTPEGKPLDH